MVVSLGTSGTVFGVTPAPVSDPTGAVAGFADASGSYLPLVATLNAARVLDAIAGVLGVDHDGLAALALESEPGAAGAVLIPYFDGERTPNLPAATASLRGLTLANTTRPQLARAAVEGMLCGLADGLDATIAVGARPRRILLIGGAALNPAVQTVAAQVFDVPVVVPHPAQYVALGGAVQAAWVLTGSRPSWEVPSRRSCRWTPGRRSARSTPRRRHRWTRSGRRARDTERRTGAWSAGPRTSMPETEPHGRRSPHHRPRRHRGADQSPALRRLRRTPGSLRVHRHLRAWPSRRRRTGVPAGRAGAGPRTGRHRDPLPRGQFRVRLSLGGRRRAAREPASPAGSRLALDRDEPGRPARVRGLAGPGRV